MAYSPSPTNQATALHQENVDRSLDFARGSQCAGIPAPRLDGWRLAVGPAMAGKSLVFCIPYIGPCISAAN